MDAAAAGASSSLAPPHDTTAAQAPSSITSPSSPAATPPARNAPARGGAYRWLRARRFPLACLLSLSSIAVSSYRIRAFTEESARQQRSRDELIHTLEQLQALVERRTHALQQQTHAVWATPPTPLSVPSSPSSPALPTSVPSSSSWLSWRSWTSWWRKDSSSPFSVSDVLSSTPLPLCASSPRISSLLALTDRRPPVALVQSVVSDCDHLLHTSMLSPSSPFADVVLPSSSALTAPSSASSPPSTTTAASSGSAVTGAVTSSGKRLMV